ncbi:MAG: hypothetical protein CMP57_02640, partial [Flavobacteriales bacterium]|nr:hypothetical protein [Flavobacteriales bacterium]
MKCKNLLLASILFLSQINTAFSQCDLPLEFTGNTGANMTILFQSSFFTDYPDLSGAYVVAITESGLVVGSASTDGSQGSIAVWGDDSITPESDGAMSGESFTLQLVNGNDLYDISTDDLSYTTNSFIPLFSSSVTLNCSGGGTVSPDVPGCMDMTAFNYNSEATSDDGSCEYDNSSNCPILDFSYINTGNNMTIVLTQAFVSSQNILEGTSMGLFYLSQDGEPNCAGAADWTGGMMTIAAWG